MRIRKALRTVAIPFTLILASCGTSYHSAGLGGGYSEIVTSTDSFLVTFKGNGYTSDEKVLKYALQRASELTLQNGYRYFAVLSSMDQTRFAGHSNTRENVPGSANAHSWLDGSISSSTYSEVIHKPGLTLGIKCFQDKPEDLEVIDAQYYLEKN